MGGPRRRGQTRGDNKGHTNWNHAWTDGWAGLRVWGGVKRRVVCPLSLLLLLRGLTLSAGCQKGRC